MNRWLPIAAWLGAVVLAACFWSTGILSAGVAGFPLRTCEAPFFGQDALHSPAEGRVALFNHNHDVAIYRDDPGMDSYAPAPRNPALERLGVAYFQTAYELFESGRYLPSAPTGRVARNAPAGG